MKSSDIRTMSISEVERKISESVEALFNLRLQHSIGQLEDTSKIKQNKKNIARLKTILTEMRRNEKRYEA